MGGPPQEHQLAWRIGAAGLVAWVVLAGASGGLDTGRLPAGNGAAGLAWGLCGAAILAVAAIGIGRLHGSRTTWVALSAFAGLLVWTALSIAWSIAPDLSWLAANRTAIAFGALVAGAALATRVPKPAEALAMGLTAAGAPILLWALGSRVVADLLAPVNDIPRLNAPLGLPNSLALLAVLGVPGAMLMAATRRWREAASAWMAVAFTVIALTGSRSGLMALIVAVAIAVWWFPSRSTSLAVLGAGILGAIIPVLYAVAGSDLTQTPLPSLADRRTPGLVLGVLVLVGTGIAIAIAGPLAPAAARLARVLDRRVAGVALAAGTVAIVAAGAAVAILGGRDAADSTARLTSSNHRWDWWQQAVRGFADAPLAGHGAGSFPFTNLRERTEPFETLRVRQPHQLGLEFLSEVGLVGFLLGVVALGAVILAARRAGRVCAPALAILVPFLVQAQLDIPWSFPALAGPAMAAAGVMLALAPARPATAGTPWPRVAVAGVCAVAAIGSGLIPWVASRRATAALIDIAPAIGVSADPEPDGARIAAAADRARRAADLNPLAAAPLILEAQGRFAAGDTAGARAAAVDATGRQPDNPFAWQCLAAVTTGAEQTDATARWDRLDPQRDRQRPAACRPTS